MNTAATSLFDTAKLTLFFSNNKIIVRKSCQYLEHLKSLLHLLRHYVCIGLFMCVDIFEQLLGMCLCLDFFAGENSTYYALFIDKKCCAYGADSGFAIHFFSPHAPRLCRRVVPVSAMRGNESEYLSANFACVSSLSLLTPTISYPSALSSSLWLSREQASAVQPGVLALGYV